MMKQAEKVVLKFENEKQVVAIKFGNVYVTKDYESFNWLVGNRRTDARNIAKITNSMKKKLYPTVIIVNEKGEIIDGQHRFLSARSLGKDIHFMIVDGLTVEDAIQMNSNGGKKWDYRDYMTSHISMGNKNYIEFNDVVETYGINIGDAFNVIHNVNKKETLGIIRKKFMDGEMLITEDLRLAFKDIFNKVEDFNMFDGNKDTSFVKAFIDLYFFDGYNHAQMRKKLDKYSKSLIKCSDKRQYLEVLTEIYSKNEKVSEKIISVNKKK